MIQAEEVIGNIQSKETTNALDCGTKKEIDIIKMLCFAVSGILSAICLGLTVYTLITGKDPYNRLVNYICSSILFASLILVKAILKKRLPNAALLTAIIFAFFSAFCGFAFHFYERVPYYDKIMHSIFGYIGCLAGLYLLCAFGDYRKLRPVCIVIMCFAVSMACGAVWEITEFIGDVFLGQTAQGVTDNAVSGGMSAITDTMLDLICNFGGACVFTLHYIIHKKTGKNLLMKNIIDSFSGNPIKKFKG